MDKLINEVAHFLNVGVDSLTEKKDDGKVLLKADVNIKELLTKRLTEVVETEVKAKTKNVDVESVKKQATRSAFEKVEKHLKHLGANIKVGDDGAWQNGIESLVVNAKQQVQSDDEAIKGSELYKNTLSSWEQKVKDAENALLNERKVFKRDKIDRKTTKAIRDYLKSNKDKLNIPDNEDQLNLQVKALKVLAVNDGLEIDLDNNDIIIKQGGEVYKKDFNPVTYSNLLDKVAPVMFGIKDNGAAQTTNTNNTTTTTTPNTQLNIKTDADLKKFSQSDEYKNMKTDQKLELITRLKKEMTV